MWLLPLLLMVLACVALPAAAHGQTTGPCLPDGTGPTCHFWTARVLDVNDGDTIGVDILGDGVRRHEDVRFSGVQTMELRRFNPRRRAGECHSVAATLEVERLIRRSDGIVRLSAQDPGQMQGSRLRRWVAVRSGGRWLDLGEHLVRRGLALWMGGQVEHAWNATYGSAEQLAARAGRRLWNPGACGAGPSPGVPARLWVNWNPFGDDLENGGEWVKVRNVSPDRPLDLGGWSVRDASHLRFTFPRGTVLPPGVVTTVHVSSGRDWYADFFWGLDRRVFENASGDGRHLGGGAYLVDPDGDIRAAMQYPCVVVCANPLQGGALLVRAVPVAGDWAAVQNRSGVPVSLDGYALEVRGGFVPIPDGTVLAPGAAQVVDVPGFHSLPNRGGVVRVTTFDGVPVACDAWGTGRCP